MSTLAESIEEMAVAIFEVLDAPQTWASANTYQRDLYRRASAAALERRSRLPITPETLREVLTRLALTDTDEIPMSVAIDRCLAEMGLKA